MSYDDIRDAFPEFWQFQLIYQNSSRTGAIFIVQTRGAAREREQALKLVCLPNAEDERAASHARCEREFGIPDIINHPGILRVFKSLGERLVLVEPGKPRSHYAYTMEVCNGSVEDLLRRKCPILDRLSFIRDLLETVSYLHANFIVHRDIKPHNLLIARPSPDALHPRCRLADFTFAVSLRERAQLGLLPDQGTPPYRAPECMPNATELDFFKADQFSVGVTIYQILACGRLPWRMSGTGSPTAGPADEPLLVPIGDGLERMPTSAPEVERVLRTMMARSAQARYPDMTICMRSLRAALLNDGLPTWPN